MKTSVVFIHKPLCLLPDLDSHFNLLYKRKTRATNCPSGHLLYSWSLFPSLSNHVLTNWCTRLRVNWSAVCMCCIISTVASLQSMSLLDCSSLHEWTQRRSVHSGLCPLCTSNRAAESSSYCPILAAFIVLIQQVILISSNLSRFLIHPWYGVDLFVDWLHLANSFFWGGIFQWISSFRHISVGVSFARLCPPSGPCLCFHAVKPLCLWTSLSSASVNSSPHQSAEVWRTLKLDKEEWLSATSLNDTLLLARYKANQINKTATGNKSLCSKNSKMSEPMSSKRMLHLS